MINKYIIYYNVEGGKCTCDLTKKRLEQIFLTPFFYGIGLYNESELVGIAVGCFKQFDYIQIFYLEEILVFKEYQTCIVL